MAEKLVAAIDTCAAGAPCEGLISRESGDQLSQQDIGSRLTSGLSYKTAFSNEL
jgi:hypothetical protein